MYWLKTCPRCLGDLHQEEDYYGKYIACVQCGYMLKPLEEQALRATGRLDNEPVASGSKAA